MLIPLCLSGHARQNIGFQVALTNPLFATQCAVFIKITKKVLSSIDYIAQIAYGTAVVMSALSSESIPRDTVVAGLTIHTSNSAKWS